MTREEQIVKYANSFKGKGIESDELKEIVRLAIIDGAKWADAHPQKPSLPSNLEETAEEYADYNSRRWQEDGDIYYDHSKIMDAFKAGAEWMAEQGETVAGTFHHSRGYPSVIELKTYLRDYEGEDVIVQIRKKED